MSSFISIASCEPKFLISDDKFTTVKAIPLQFRLRFSRALQDGTAYGETENRLRTAIFPP